MTEHPHDEEYVRDQIMLDTRTLLGVTLTPGRYAELEAIYAEGVPAMFEQSKKNQAEWAAFCRLRDELTREAWLAQRADQCGRGWHADADADRRETLRKDFRDGVAQHFPG